MSDQADQTRRWLINVSGAAILSGAIPGSSAQAAPAPGARTDAETISPDTITLADYVAKALDRELPAEVVTRTKLHVLDTFAAMVSGSRLKPGELAARYVDSLGGKPQAIVIGSGIVTSAVNAALANAMSAHADETDDTNPVGPVHLGCSAVSSALATAELADRTGRDLLRAVTLGYDVGARVVAALGVGQGPRRRSPSVLTSTRHRRRDLAAMLRLDQRQVRHTLSYAAQQASGIGFWTRDHEHIEKAFDFGGMGARNGVMAATMVAMGFSAVDDPFSGRENIYTALADNPAPEKLIAELGSSYAVFGTTIKKWSVGAPLQAVLDSMATLLADSAVREGNIKHIRVDMPTERYDRRQQHHPRSLPAAPRRTDDRRPLTNFAACTMSRMSDPRVLAGSCWSSSLAAKSCKGHAARQAIVRIETMDGRSPSYPRGPRDGGQSAGREEIEAKANRWRPSSAPAEAGPGCRGRRALAAPN
jgi:hypothetical protein